MLSKGAVIEVGGRAFVADGAGEMFPHPRSCCDWRRRLPLLLPGCAATPVGWSATCWGMSGCPSALHVSPMPCLCLGHALVEMRQSSANMDARPARSW